MKIRHVFFVIVFLALLSACKSVALNIVPTATATSTLEGGIVLTARPTRTVTPSRTPTITYTPSASRTPKNTLTPTASLTSRPTPTSPYPVGPKTPLPTRDFQAITAQNVSQLTPIFKIVRQSIWQSAVSRDGKKFFVAANNGLFVYDRQGQQLSYWPSLILPSLPCETCLSINTDGSRFVVAVHKDGKWFAQVYNVYENSANLLLEKSIVSSVQGIVNEARIAISPDGLLLAYGAGDSDTLLIDMNSSQTLLTNKGRADAAIFSPTGAYLVIRRAREMLFWKTPVWKSPRTLQLPAADTPYAFSPDGKLLALALSDKVRAYALDKLTPSREIPISTPKDLKRIWQIAFLDEKTLAGYDIRWDSDHAKATIDFAQWNLDTGATLQMRTSESDSPPDALSALWGVNVPLTAAPGPVALGQYSVVRFSDQDPDQLRVNSLHSACWLKLSSGETACFDDPKFEVLSSQTDAYREIPQQQTTLIQSWNGTTLFKLPQPYPILGMNWTAEYFVVNVKDITTDIYFKGRNPPLGSFPGTLLASAENADRLVYCTQQKNSTGGIITMINKRSLETPYQKKVDFILKPLAIGNDNRVYFVQRDVGQQKFVLKAISAINFAITNVGLLSLPAEPEVMAVSLVGAFAFGLRDGSVAIVSSDGLQVASFQAVYTPITAISITPDGRYLAVASDDGIRVFAVLP
jgi:WD40 repeat protein